MFKIEHLMDLKPVISEGIYSELIWFLRNRGLFRYQFKKMFPASYAVITCKKIDLPMYVSHKDEDVRIIAHYRMRHNI